MKCFYHPEKDGVGLCSSCGKSACRECIEDIRGSMLCKGCMVRALEHQETEREAVAVQAQLTRESAAQKIRISRKLFIVFAVIATVISVIAAVGSFFDPKTRPTLAEFAMLPFMGPTAGYMVWAAYWGIPPVWRGWWNMFRGIGCFLIANPFTLLILMAMLFEIPLLAGFYYGLFGGGIYQYVKARRIAA